MDTPRLDAPHKATLATVAEAVEHNAVATADSARVSLLMLKVLSLGVAFLILLVVAFDIGFVLYVQHRADGNDSNYRLLAAQSACFTEVQGNYIKQIGLLADSNGASLRGEPIDPQRNRDRVIALRKASEYVAKIRAICYTDSPDETPLDGILPDGTVIVPSG